ncbi:MAG: glycosyltransferase family 39 protein [Methanobrevibacter sp.]|jgi:hypothetical protein|nr:glycosyltransferase family 39 protein [Candidatus Methanovirga meridionalis]
MINKLKSIQDSLIAKLTEKNIGGILFISSFILFFILLIKGFPDISLRYDEIFTMHLVKDTIGNIIYQTAMDVHPPLHYFIVKAFISIGHLFHSSFSDIFLAKLSSATPILLLMIFSWKYLKKDIGYLAAGLFSLSVVLMPQFDYYMADVRMYSWGMLFLTLAFYSAYRISIDGSWKNYALLIFFGILGEYTQYYCSVTLFAVYLVLFAWLALKNEVMKVKKLILSGIISVAAFIPWMGILLNQISYVSNSFWIAEFNSKTLLQTVWYVLSSRKVGDTTYTLVHGAKTEWEGVVLLILIVLILAISLYYLFKENISLNSLKRIGKINFLTFSALITVLEVLLGMLLSDVIGKEILHVRYIVIGLALFWLSVCIIISKTFKKSKPVFLVLMFLFLLGGGLNLSFSFHKMDVNTGFAHSIQDVLKLIDPDDLVIDGDLSTTGFRELLMSHPDENTYIGQLDTYWEPPFMNVYSSQHNMSIFGGNLMSRVNKTLESGHNVWIYGISNGHNNLMTIRNSQWGYLDFYKVKAYTLKKAIIPGDNGAIYEIIAN